MKSFLFRIAKENFKFAFFAWCFVALLEFAFFKFIEKDIDGRPLFLSPLMFFLLIFAVSMGLSAQLWTAFLRQISQNIRQFWMLVVGISALNVVLNGFFCVLVFLVFEYFGILKFPNELSIMAIVWTLLISFTIGLLCSSNPAAIQAKIANHPKIFGIFIFVLFICVLALIYATLTSLLVASVLAEVMLLSLFLLTNSFLSATAPLAARYRIMTLSIAGVLGLGFLTYQFEIRKSDKPSSFLGVLGPMKVWKFEDLETVQTPSEWLAWFKNANFENAQQTNVALEKLETLCPLRVTEFPTRIECHEKDAQYQKYFIVRKPDETSILERLNSKNIYTQLLGLLTARNLNEFSDALKKKIEEISKTTGRLAPVAAITLSHHHEGHGKASVLLIIQDEE